MEIENLIECLSSENRVNEALSFLAQIVVDNDSLVSKLVELIEKPHLVEDTNRFASLLYDLNSEKFIEPIIKKIEEAVPDATVWLADYMYALNGILSSLDDLYLPEESFVHLLGDWMLNTGGGEISWKAGSILGEMEHAECGQYYEKGLRNQDLFVLTRLSCLRGLVNQYGSLKMELYKEFINDPDEELREAAQEAISWLELGGK